MSINLDDTHSLISQVLLIDISLTGTSSDNFIAQYSGTLKKESELAHQILTNSLSNKDVLPLFRRVLDKDTITLVYKPKVKPNPNIALNISMFLLTLISVFFAGALYGSSKTIIPDPLSSISHFLSFLLSGMPFALSLLAILLAHEFGHYFAARHHKIRVTLPFFIPMPLGILGTMGAFIQMKETPKNRKALFDIAIAGPLSGLIVAIPILVYGLITSDLHQLPIEAIEGQGFEGNSILYLLSKFLVFGKLLPEQVGLEGFQLLLYWIRYFFTGTPIPWGGYDVQLNPVAWAGWAGLLITMLNLIPAGQLDGGHIFYATFYTKIKRLTPIIVGLLLLLGIVWSSWWVWAILILLFGRTTVEPLDLITPIDSKRKKIGIAMLILFILIFSPVPLMII